jgi:hypothetical protein
MPAEEVKSESAKKNEDWMNSKWRPAMGWMYMAVCMADFVLFPVLWSLVQVIGGGRVETQWSPITYKAQACSTWPWVLSWVSPHMVGHRKNSTVPTMVA